MADSSFDVVSKVDKQEADNALQQAVKEVEQRYDFKGVGASIEWSGEKIMMKASSEDRVKADEPRISFTEWLSATPSKERGGV
jgi:uncharacterized protein YajQ (UPF0234 family)